MTRAQVGRTRLWIITGFAALAFVVAGRGKFTNPFWAKSFLRWGYSDGFRLAIGILEMAGGLLIAFPRSAVYGAIVIDAIMLGAFGTLIRFHEPRSAPLFWIAIVSAIGYARRRDAWRPTEREIRATIDTV